MLRSSLSLVRQYALKDLYDILKSLPVAHKRKYDGNAHLQFSLKGLFRKEVSILPGTYDDPFFFWLPLLQRPGRQIIVDHHFVIPSKPFSLVDSQLYLRWTIITINNSGSSHFESWHILSAFGGRTSTLLMWHFWMYLSRSGKKTNKI